MAGLSGGGGVCVQQLSAPLGFGAFASCWLVLFLPCPAGLNLPRVLGAG